MADTADLKSAAERRRGSTPLSGTMIEKSMDYNEKGGSNGRLFCSPIFTIFGQF